MISSLLSKTIYFPIEMDVENILLQCVLCPGVCTYKCPVYRTSFLRAAAPVNIARALYRYVTYKDEEFLLNSGYCSLCGECEKACPIDNPLPKAILTLRSKVLNNFELAYEEYERHVNIFIPDDIKIDESHLNKEGFEEIYLVSSEEFYYNVISGYTQRIRQKSYFNEDVDVFENRFSIELLERLKVKVDILSYILHVPCKLDGRYTKKFINVFGEPEKIIFGCVGGGGIDVLAPNLTKRIIKTFGGYDMPIISQCGRAVRILRRNGVEAYTPLEAVTKWKR